MGNKHVVWCFFSQLEVGFKSVEGSGLSVNLEVGKAILPAGLTRGQVGDVDTGKGWLLSGLQISIGSR